MPTPHPPAGVSRPTPHAPCAGRPAAQGFTLIELMVVVVVIAILSAIALPSYSDYVLRGRLTDATNALSAMQANMERYFQDNRTYAVFTSAADVQISPPCATATTAGTFTLSCPATDPTGNAASNPGASAYTVIATGSATTAGFKYSINQLGVRETLEVPNTQWATCASTWILKKGQSCP